VTRPASAPLRRRVLAESPVGPLTLVASPEGLREIRFGVPSGPEPAVAGGAASGETPSDLDEAAEHLELAERALAAALRPASESPDLHVPPLPPLDLSGGTAFQQAVWRALLRIPRGQVRSYGDLARELGQGSPRAVGQAVGRNPLPVLVPCHRVVAGAGRLGGFSGGLERKVRLLEIEGYHAADARFDARLEGPEALELPFETPPDSRPDPSPGGRGT
jgi:methylated-DNA-[protein]-cysteine S-methyltransferase